MKVCTVPLKWKQHDVSMKRVVQRGKGDKPKGESSLLWALTRSAPPVSLCGFFSAPQLTASPGAHNTAPQLWAEKEKQLKGSTFFLKQAS